MEEAVELGLQPEHDVLTIADPDFPGVLAHEDRLYPLVHIEAQVQVPQIPLDQLTGLDDADWEQWLLLGAV